MTIDDLTIDAERFWLGEEPWDGLLAFVDLDRQMPDRGRTIALPACPVIGLGDSACALGDRLDAIIEPPIDAGTVLARVERTPNAAAAIVQLLRILPGLSSEAGLIAESMAYAMLQGSTEHRAWLDSSTAERSEPGRLEVARDGDRLVITLDRPEAGNAIDRPMRDALHEAFTLASLDASVEEVSLRARGKAFCLGADLAEFGTTADPATAHAIRSRTLPARAALGCADKLNVHIDGACVGAGLEIAAYARRITASPRAWFQLPELAMGILPGAGGCVSLTRRMGRQRTALMILSGKRLSASQALAWGLIDAIVDEPA